MRRHTTAPIEPGYAGVEPFALRNKSAGLGFEPRDIFFIAWALDRQSAATRQLQGRELASQKSALVEQPGEHMHEPGCRAQALDRQGYACQIVGRGPVRGMAKIESLASGVGEYERLGIEVLDDFFIQIASGHGAWLGPPMPSRQRIYHACPVMERGGRDRC